MPHDLGIAVKTLSGSGLSPSLAGDDADRELQAYLKYQFLDSSHILSIETLTRRENERVFIVIVTIVHRIMRIRS